MRTDRDFISEDIRVIRQQLQIAERSRDNAWRKVQQIETKLLFTDDLMRTYHSRVARAIAMLDGNAKTDLEREVLGMLKHG